MALHRLEPFGEWRADWRAAQIASLLFNIHRGKSKARPPADFMWRAPQTAAQRQAGRDKDTRAFMAALDAVAIPKQEPIR